MRSWETSYESGTDDIILKVCYRPPNQEHHTDEALYQQIEAVSLSQALDLMGDFSHPNICWKNSTAMHRWSQRFLECLHDNFLLQVTEEPMRRKVHYWSLLSSRRSGWCWMWSLREILASVTMKKCSLGFWRQQRRNTAGLLSWTLGEKTLPSLAICVVEYLGLKPWREEGSKNSS